MIDHSQFTELYEKFKQNALTKTEFDQFLEMVRHQKDDQLLASLLDASARDYGAWKVDSTKKSKHQFSLIYRVAAALLLVIGSVIVYYFLNKVESAQSWATGNGERMEIVLPDSSQVVLNANSQLTWVKSSQLQRKVKLSGEAFFEVVHTHDDRSFTVETDASRITVLGTSFNVNSRDKTDEIFLLEGAIQLESVRKKHAQSVILDPGESALISEAALDIEISRQSSGANAMAWKNGLLRFSDVTVATILERMEEIYGKKISVENTEVLEMEMEFTLPYANWPVTSKALALALNLTLEENGDHVELK